MQLLKPGLLFYTDTVNEAGPKRNELYVIAEDNSVHAVHDPNKKLSWQILEKDDGFFCQIGEELVRCLVRYSGQAGPEVMNGIKALGVLGQKRARGEKVTPMDAANALGDPVQTEASAKFERGELSYAEMRGLCG